MPPAPRLPRPPRPRARQGPRSGFAITGATASVPGQPLARWDRGFTLAEIVLALGIAALILPVLALLVYQGTTLTAQKSAEFLAENELRNFHDWLQRDLVDGPAGNNLKDPTATPTAGATPTANAAATATPTATQVPRIIATPGAHLSTPPQTLITLYRSPWPGVTISPAPEVITYTLEPDATTGGWKVMRNGPAGDSFAVLRHLADPSHIYVTGDPRSEAGKPSTGIWIDVMVSVRAPLDSDGQLIAASTPQPPISQTATATPLPGVTRRLIAYFEPRSFQPVPTPTAPARCVWNIPVPTYMVAGTGYYHVIENAGTATLAAEWRTTSVAAISLRIYTGTPFGPDSGLSTVDPKTAKAPLYTVATGASASATTNLLTVATTDPMPAGQYTGYFFNSATDATYVTSSSATATHAAFYRSDRC